MFRKRIRVRIPESRAKYKTLVAVGLRHLALEQEWPEPNTIDAEKSLFVRINLDQESADILDSIKLAWNKSTPEVVSAAMQLAKQSRLNP